MRALLVIFRIRLSEILQYRAVAISTVITQIFWGLMAVFIINTFTQNTTHSTIPLFKIVSYIWLTRMFAVVLSPFSSTNLGEIIKSGGIAYELLRPLNFFSYWYSRILAERIAKISYSIFFIGLVAFLLPDKYALHLPKSLGVLVLFILSLLLSLLIISAYEFLFDLLAFFSVSYYGISRIMGQVFFLLSGTVIPVPLMPAAFRKVIEFLPFSTVADIPFRIFAGYSLPVNILFMYSKQIVWLCLFLLAGNILVKKGVRKVELYGG